jgi:uncharacterized delta-60 repeat protein
MATALAIESDGKIVIAGQLQTPANGGQPVVMRLTTNGALDTTFGHGGVVTLVLGHGGGELATGIVVQSDGKIVLALSTGNADAAPVLELVRFTANGIVDTSFGGSGSIVLLRNGPDSALLAQQPDGKMLLAGGMLLVRVHSDGSLDSSFGNAGIAETLAVAPSIALQTNGQIVLALNRYDANGTLDAGFGILGRAPGILTGTARIQADGKIDVAGPVNTRVLPGPLPGVKVETGFGLMRYDSNGTIDTSFGNQGGFVIDFGSAAPFATPLDAVIEPSGDIIVAGQGAQVSPAVFGAAPSVFALARVTGTGTLDTNFGSGGKVLTSLGASATAGIVAVALDSQGRLIAAGNVSSLGNPGAIAVARYLTK